MVWAYPHVTTVPSLSALTIVLKRSVSLIGLFGLLLPVAQSCFFSGLRLPQLECGVALFRFSCCSRLSTTRVVLSQGTSHETSEVLPTQLLVQSFYRQGQRQVLCGSGC